MIRYAYYEPKDWVIAAAIPEADFLAGVEAVGGAFDQLQLSMLCRVSYYRVDGVVSGHVVQPKEYRCPGQKADSSLVDAVSAGDFSLRLNLEQKDEIGHLSRSLDGMADHLQEYANVASTIAGGDLAVKINTASDKDSLGLALSADGQ